MSDLGDIPILSRGAIPGAAGAGAKRPEETGLVWLEDAEEGEPRPVEHLRPHKDDDPPALLWI